MEVGGSAGHGGFTLSKGIDNDIYLLTGTLGISAGGGEVHAFGGTTKVYDWINNKWYE
jgi:hypothetical protein